MFIKKVSTPAPKPFSELKTLGIMRLSAIGDILNLLPSLELTLTSYPELKVIWYIGKGEYQCFKELATKYPNLHFVVIDKKAGYLKSIKQLKADTATLLDGQELDLLLHLQTSARSNIFAYSIKAKEKIGFSIERSFEGHSKVCKTSPFQTSMHVMFDYFDIFRPHLRAEEVKSFYALVPDSKAFYDIRDLYYQDDEQREYSLDLVNQEPQVLHKLIDLGYGEAGSEKALSFISDENKVLYQDFYQLSRFNKSRDAKQKLIIVNPASSARKKNWTTSGYIDVIKYCLAEGHKVVVTGSPNPSEQVFVIPIVEAVEKYLEKSNAKDNFYDLSGKTSLAELVLFTELADLMISPDSGPMHLASCLGIPTLGLFAYINPMRSGPIQGLADTISVYHINKYSRDNDYSENQFLLDLAFWRSAPEQVKDSTPRWRKTAFGQSLSDLTYTIRSLLTSKQELDAEEKLAEQQARKDKKERLAKERAIEKAAKEAALAAEKAYARKIGKESFKFKRESSTGEDSLMSQIPAEAVLLKVKDMLERQQQQKDVKQEEVAKVESFTVEKVIEPVSPIVSLKTSASTLVTEKTAASLEVKKQEG